MRELALEELKCKLPVVSLENLRKERVPPFSHNWHQITNFSHDYRAVCIALYSCCCCWYCCCPGLVAVAMLELLVPRETKLGGASIELKAVMRGAGASQILWSP
jgi:hypothetical protein